MSDMKLFKIDGVSATEIEGESVAIEKFLQEAEELIVHYKLVLSSANRRRKRQVFKKGGGSEIYYHN